MNNYAQELFLLITTLSQLKNKDRIVQFFIESLNDVFRDYSFAWVPEKSVECDTVVEVCTRNKNYGYILFIANKVPDAVIFDLIRNTSQLLALLLEKLEQDELLLNQKNHLQTLVDERTNELQKINLKLEEELTGRRRVEKALAESSTRYQELFENANIAIFQSTLDGKVIMVNPEFARMFGYQSPEEVAATVEDVSTDIFADPERRAEIVRLKSVHPELNEFENLYRRKDGSTFLGKLRLHSVMDADDCTRYFEGFIEDITERKRAEVALNMASLYARSLIEASLDPLVTISADGKITDVNKATESVTGITRERLIYSDFSDYFTEPEKAREGYQQVLEQGLVRDYPLTIRHTSGITTDVLYNATIYRNESGEIQGVFAAARDITERKQAEEEIKLKNEQLLKLNAEKDKFFSIIAHDLRSPFNGFLGLTEIMVKELNSLTMDEIKVFSVSMRNSAANIFSLLENLLQWSRMQQGSIPFNPELLQLLQVVEECFALAKETAKNKGVEIAYHVADDIKVFADRNILQTIIRNLVSNAVKFTPKGGEIYVSAITTEDNSVELSIKDTGIGMTGEMISNLFRLEAKTNREGTDGEPSSGLGLLLCKEFVEKLGGKIWVESEVGKGTTFYFTTPKQ